MAFEEVKEEFKDLKESTKEYIDSNIRYYQLWGLKISAKAVSYIFLRFIVGIFAMISILFLSLAAAFAIGNSLERISLGFLIIGLFYLLIIGLVLLFRQRLIVKPVIKKFSNIFYND